MARTSASASVEVAVDPHTAFSAFTEEIDRWWVPGPINYWSFARAIGKRIEPGVGGRILELYDGDALELGRITVWQPGERLTYRSTVDDTEVDIRFAAIPGGTRVSVDHYLRPGGDPTRLALFWPRVIRWLVPWCASRASAPAEPPRLARVTVSLQYKDPAAAAQWLRRVFGFTRWSEIAGEDDHPQWIDVTIGEVLLVLFPAEKPDIPPSGHGIWVYVDDLEAHHAHSKAEGAAIRSDIHEYGFRSYEVEDLDGRVWTFVQSSPTVR